MTRYEISTTDQTGWYKRPPHIVRVTEVDRDGADGIAVCGELHQEVSLEAAVRVLQAVEAILRVLRDGTGNMGESIAELDAALSEAVY